MGGSKVAVLQVCPAVSSLEHGLAPAPPGAFVAQGAARLLWWESGIAVFNRGPRAYCVQASTLGAGRPRPQGALRRVKETRGCSVLRC